MSQTPDSWHRRGVRLSLVALIVIIVVLALEIPRLPSNWHVTTRHSDRPAQVVEAIAELEEEIVELRAQADFRVVELEAAKARAERKAEECRIGKGESGETVDEAKKRELLERAPEWDRAAQAAADALGRVSR